MIKSYQNNQGIWIAEYRGLSAKGRTATEAENNYAGLSRMIRLYQLSTKPNPINGSILLKGYTKCQSIKGE